MILTVNGLRVPVIGAMTDTLHSLSTPKLLEEWHTLPVFDTVRKYAAELRDKSDLIVLLAHITGEVGSERALSDLGGAGGNVRLGYWLSTPNKCVLGGDRQQISYAVLVERIERGLRPLFGGQANEFWNALHRSALISVDQPKSKPL